MAFIVAIDGPTSSGKSTLASGISKRLNFVNIQTGAMYRCIAKLMLDNNIDIDNLDGIQKILDDFNIEFKNDIDGQHVFLKRRRCNSTNKR